MAKKYELEIDIKTGKAIKSVEQLDDSVKNTKESTEDLSTATSKLDGVTGGLISKVKGSITALKGMTTGFKTLRGAIISTGIGALVVAIGSLIAAFQSSEEGQNRWGKAMTVIGTVVGNFTDLLADLGEKLIWVFENPKQALNDFGALIKENIINRFEGLTELIPQLGKAITQLFDGDFVGAGKTAFNAVAKITVGVDDMTGKIEGAAKAFSEFTNEQAREANLAIEVANMRAKADKIERQLLIDRSKLESQIAENRLKARQQETFSADERKAFLLEAQDLENQLLDKETSYLTLRRDAQVLENSFSRSNKENLDKEAESIAAVNQQQARRADAARALQRELNQVNNELSAADKARQQEAIALEKAKNDFIKNQRDALALDQEQKFELEKIKTQEKYDALIAQAVQFNLDTTSLEEAKLVALKQLQDKYDQENAEKENAKNQKEIDDKKGIADSLDQIEAQKRASQLQTLDNAIAIAGEENALGKALLIAKQILAAREAIIDTKASATKAASAVSDAGVSAATAGVNVAEGASKTLSKGFPTNIPLLIAYAAQAVGIISAIRSATQKVKGAGAPSIGSVASAPSLPQAVAPQINTVGSSGVNQIADAINQRPVKAYVVSGDVTTAQQLDRNIIKEAGI